MDSPTVAPVSTNWFKTSIAWLAAIFTEPDGNGGKASFSRVGGAFVLYHLIVQSYLMAPDFSRIEPSSTLWDMFMVLVGYGLLSKTLNNVSPAVIDFARGYLVKAQTKAASKITL